MVFTAKYNIEIANERKGERAGEPNPNEYFVDGDVCCKRVFSAICLFLYIILYSPQSPHYFVSFVIHFVLRCRCFFGCCCAVLSVIVPVCNLVTAVEFQFWPLHFHTPSHAIQHRVLACIVFISIYGFHFKHSARNVRHLLE